MSALTTDQLYRKITEKAIDDEQSRIEKILWDAHKAIGLQGRSMKTHITDTDGKATIVAYSDDIIRALAKRRLEEVKSTVAQKAVDDFISSVDTFKKHLSTIESYQLLNGGEDA